MSEFLGKLIDWITEQFEIVIPGLSILIILLYKTENSVSMYFLSILSKEEFSWKIPFTLIIGLFGIYVLGLVATQISKLIINSISQNTFIPYFMTKKGIEGPKDKRFWRDRKVLFEIYRVALRRGHLRTQPGARKEFNKRRQRSRIIRSLVSPLLLYSSYFQYWFLACTISYLVILFLYSYSESGIYDETIISS